MQFSTTKSALATAFASAACIALFGNAANAITSLNPLEAPAIALDSFDETPIVAFASATLPAPEPLALTSTYARAGWQATLRRFAHNVSGTVTIVDENTFRVDNFFYDGGGIDVHFILAAEDNNTVFRTNRLVTSLNLLGTPFNGGSITIDLPEGSTFDNYNAISLWCIPAQANFGSGTFVNPIPEPASAPILALGATVFAAMLRRRSARAF
jgi:hypothetical protein